MNLVESKGKAKFKAIMLPERPNLRRLGKAARRQLQG